MEQYKPQYQIIPTEAFVPREQMQLNPEKELDPFGYIELCNIKRGISYKAAVLDTPENRRAINLKTTYFQMVAHKEGWKFNPELYQVVYFSPGKLDRNSDQSRIYSFVEGAETPFRELYPDRVGFDIVDKRAIRMLRNEADGLVRKVLRLFSS